MHPGSNPDHSLAENWRPSGMAGGNPGESDALVFTGDPEEDADGDGVPAYLEHGVGTSDRDPADGDLLSFGREAIAVAGVTDDYFTVSFPRDRQAEDVVLIPEASLDLVDWVGGPITLVFVSEVPTGGTRTLVTYRVSTPLGDHGELFVRLRGQARE
jgi:hypothetical protein